MSKVILVKANKGGVGKSWLTLQLAHATALRDKKVLIITSDSQNNIPRFAGIKDSNFKEGLEYWIKNKTGTHIELRNNLSYIPLTTMSIPDEDIDKFKNFIEVIKSIFDYIYIDATPVLNLDDIFLEVSDQIVIPTFLDSVTTSSITNMLKKAEYSKIKAIIPNRATRCKVEKEYYKKLVETLVGTSIFVSCPISQSAIISRLIEEGKTLFDKTKYNTSKFRAIIEKALEVLL